MPDSDIQRLVERIEGATGPDRELDRDIGWAISIQPAPAYTASIDAALTLVPKDAFDHAEIYSPDHQTLGWTFHLMSNANFLGRTFTGFGATLALALCAAALRARMTLDA